MMFMKRYDWVFFVNPNAEKAPWHVQAVIKGEGPYDALVNFWPHKAKAQREGHKVVEGWDNIRNMMSEIIEENGFDEIAEVLE